MKRILFGLLCCCFLVGCGMSQDPLYKPMQLREQLTEKGCAFEVEVTADYLESLLTFTLDCVVDAKGTLDFTVVAPQEIAGIQGKIQAGQGRLVFADTVLSVPLLAEGELSPLSGPWVLITALRGGYMVSAGKEGELLRLSVNDSYAENALRVEVWLDSNLVPQNAEVYHQGRRVLSMTIKDFHFV